MGRVAHRYDICWLPGKPERDSRYMYLDPINSNQQTSHCSTR